MQITQHDVNKNATKHTLAGYLCGIGY